MLEKVRFFAIQHGLFSFGEKIIVGVSGGPDSLCLLHVLNRLKGEWDIKLHAAHLNHMIRGAAADEDAAFVETIAREWGIPCTIETRNVPALAQEKGMSLEEAARYARYEFLAEVATREGARTIAVGHNADDQVETVVMHWVRGSGLAGLRGMLPRSRLVVGSKEYDLWLIRPLLEVTRAEIEAYCRENGLTPRFDLSNLDTTYFRNRLRHELIPYLETFNPRFRELVRRSAQLFADDYDFLRRQVEASWRETVEREGEEGIVFSLPLWKNLHPAMQRGTLREAIRRMRRGLRDIGWVHIENARRAILEGRAGLRVTLPHGLVLTTGYGKFFIGEEGFTPQEDLPLLPPSLAGGSEEIPLKIPDQTHIPQTDWIVKTYVLPLSELPAGWEKNPDPWRAFLDRWKISGSIKLRSRRPGDRFRPMGLRGGSKSLHEFMIDEKIPQYLRDRWPLLADEEKILWVVGHHISEEAAITSQTKEVLVVQISRDSD
ncbi:MAG: tRNA lysidine(34) synthetase TilS [Anaerolineae bacterium]|nr:tRNA lysidine(34) synthetase TilS [Anaerolineae bacterium]MDW8102700.1 tRNA lysidine(34) synthetase TilS [Anaerolineae bacterium]